MKKLFICIIMMMCLCVNNSSAQSVVKSGNTFKSIKNAVPSFITIIVMILSYSITNGIGAGIVSFAIIDFIIYLIDLVRYKKGTTKDKPKLEVTWVTLIIFILFLIYFLVPTVL